MFEAFNPTTFNSTSDCYQPDNQTGYNPMYGCKTCAGPVPSQCTSCSPKHAFVAFRNNATEGSCRKLDQKIQQQLISNSNGKVTTQIQQQFIRNGEVTTLAQWGWVQQVAVELPASEDLRQQNVNGINVDVKCGLQEILHCAKINSNAIKCDVRKKSWLLDKDAVMHLHANEATTTKLLKVPEDTVPHEWTGKIPMPQLAKFVSITNLNEACAIPCQLL